MLFAVIYCTGTYGGAITAILFNIPGAPENAPTAFDGYPMTKKGWPAKQSAQQCSALQSGGTASAVLMMTAIEPLAHWAIRNIGPPEIFALVFFGLCSVISWWQDHLERMDVGLLGLMIATIGQDPVGGINRYNFGFPDLAAGIAFVPAILGFFAVSEIFIQAEKKAFGKYNAPKLNVDFPTFAELWAHKIAVLRSIIVGFSAAYCQELEQHLQRLWDMGKLCDGQKKKKSLAPASWKV